MLYTKNNLKGLGCACASLGLFLPWHSLKSMRLVGPAKTQIVSDLFGIIAPPRITLV